MLSTRTTIDFPRIADFLPAILESLAAHGMPVVRQGTAYVSSSPFGTAALTPGNRHLAIELEAQSGPALNRIRYSLTGLIGFVAKSEQLVIDWVGDRFGKTLPPDLRILTVQEVQTLTPRMRRVVFGTDDIGRFDVREQIHARLLFQPADALRPEWPMLDDSGLIAWPDGEQRLGSRVYTIRQIDRANDRLSVDFFDHGGPGPGMNWLNRTSPGDVVGAIGPAAHGPKPARRMLLIGDETGLPGIARILDGASEELEGLALVEVADKREEQVLSNPEKVGVRWLHRDGSPAGSLADAVRAWSWPTDTNDLFVWVGCEFHDFRAIRRFLRDEVKLPSSQFVAFPHWRRGMSEEDIVAAGGEAVSA